MKKKIIKFLNKYTNESDTVNMFLYTATGSFIVIGILISFMKIKFFPIVLTLFKLFGFILALILFLCGFYLVLYNTEIEDDENDKRNNNSIDI